VITLTQANSDKGLKLETSVESTKGYLNFTYLTLKSHKQSHDTRGCLLHHLTRRVCSKSQGLRTGTRNCIASSSNNATHRHTPALPTCSLLNIRFISVPKWLTKETDSCSAGALRGLFIRTKEFHLVLRPPRMPIGRTPSTWGPNYSILSLALLSTSNNALSLKPQHLPGCFLSSI